MDTTKMLLYGGGAFLLYELFLAPKTATPGVPSSNPLSNLFSSPGATGTPTTYGVNATGVSPVQNYAALLTANPNLGNPGYTMTAAENAQYIANYLDLQQGLPSFVGHKMGNTPIGSLQQAAQVHWNTFGVPEKRIFLPMQPPSNKAYTPPPANPKSSGGSSTFSDILGVAMTVVSLLGVNDGKLNDKDLELLFTGSKVVFDILPFYADADARYTGLIGDRLTQVLNDYI